MRYDIAIRIAQDYDRPASTGRHILRLMPQTIPGRQQLIAGRLDVQPEAEERADRVDFFGNSLVEIAYRAPHESIAFEVRCRVDRRTVETPAVASPPLEALPQEIAAYASLDSFAPHHFLARSPRVGPTLAMTAYARTLVRNDMPAFEAVEAIGHALHKDITFDAEATTVDTPPEEAFAKKRGVCQDITHIMIACLRGVGIPAAYISGYLRTIPPPGKPRLAGADAMHAWVAAWIGTSGGWIEFDPTNDLRVAGDHIMVARGRDYSDIAPVKGVLRTSGSQSSKQSVDVVPLDER